eukprot:5918973-Amphidinium_carterae.1
MLTCYARPACPTIHFPASARNAAAGSTRLAPSGPKKSANNASLCHPVLALRSPKPIKTPNN